ncbi:DUF4190 domain-containing protein [Cryobacterium tepidiphilum]|uniref:DUF4190 domain-containing protein n=1 Tax=Cryobacterium tepidiphilum TaxID=2486026 RepID=A0A3M8LF01_9MICO|nr:DUF4190 domain-containing protein [Cryobacterium tepidiphilum]RNE64066.1 DUF4190 domain-containing protein [Cryobacterium tepidiphilum]
MTDPNEQPRTPSSAPQYQPGAGQPGAYGQQYGQAPQYGHQPYGQQPYGQPGRSDKYNVLAIVSLVSAFFISLVAVITGHIALHQIKRTGEQGRALAITGLVLGYLGLLAGIIVAIIVIAAIAAHPGSIGSY